MSKTPTPRKAADPAKPTPAAAPVRRAASFGMLSEEPPKELTAAEAAVYRLVFASSASQISRIDYPHVLTYCHLSVLLEKETAQLCAEGLLTDAGKANPRTSGVTALSHRLRLLSQHFKGLGETEKPSNPYADLDD